MPARISPEGTLQSKAFDISETGYIAGLAFYDVIGQQAVRWYPDGRVGRITEGVAWRALSDGSVFGNAFSGGSTLWTLTNTPTLIGPNPATHSVNQMSAVGRLVGDSPGGGPGRRGTILKHLYTCRYRLELPALPTTLILAAPSWDMSRSRPTSPST